jgi:hypothetical protein
MLYRNTFPEFLESITIGPNKSFLEKNTTYCEFASTFPVEVELMYDLKSVKTSANPLNALRNFSKKLIINGPELDVQTLNYFVKKVKNSPPEYYNTIRNETISAFQVAKKISTFKGCVSTITTQTDYYINGKKINSEQSKYNINACYVTNNTEMHNDKNFLDKLAQLLRNCNSPCDYFSNVSSSIGTLTDFGRALSDSASILGASVKDAMHAPINISTYMYNKIHPMVRGEFLKLKLMTEDVFKDGVAPFFSAKERARVKLEAKAGITPDTKYDRLPLTGDTSTYRSVANIFSEFESVINSKMGDCYRIYDYNKRYNPFDVHMNAAFAKKKYIGVKNGEVKSLIDTLGSLAPAQYVTENTYVNALDVGTNKEFIKNEDTPKAPSYNNYEGPSKGSEAVVTATPSKIEEAAGTGAQAGAGLENVPTTGKVFNFDFGEVKLTSYGYPNDETPDTGSQMAIGNASNMIVPLKTIAVNPEAINSKMVKTGDVLIITATDKSGNTFTERRQVGDTSGSNLLTGKMKFLIDEFQPSKTGFPSKLADKTNSLKLSIQVADTKEKLPVWNVAEASKFAAMFFTKKDWDNVIKKGPFKDDPLKNRIYKSMVSGEFDRYRRWV